MDARDKEYLGFPLATALSIRNFDLRNRIEERLTLNCHYLVLWTQYTYTH